MSQFDDLPMIQCKPQPVPVGHPEHPDFRGYDDIPDEPPLYRVFRGYDNVPGFTISIDKDA